MKKRWMSGTLALLLAGTTVASMMPAVSVKAEGNTANGTTYYVDSNGGNDSNEGTSEGKAFKTLDKVNALDLEPGDTVLLKKGSVFRGVQLRKHSKAREKRYSFGYAVSFIFACYHILWTFPKSRYLCSRYLPLVCG